MSSFILFAIIATITALLIAPTMWFDARKYQQTAGNDIGNPIYDAEIDDVQRLHNVLQYYGLVVEETDFSIDKTIYYMDEHFSDYMSAFILSCHHAGLSCHFIPTNACTPIDEYGNYDFIPPEGLVPEGAETYFAKVVYDVPKEPEKYF